MNLSSNLALKKENKNYSILICSNVTLHPFEEFLESELASLNVAIRVADFDNIWMDAEKSSSDFVFIHNDILNITPDYVSKFFEKSYSDSLIEHLLERIKCLKEKQAKPNSPYIITTNLSALPLELIMSNNNVEQLCRKYNESLNTISHSIVDFSQHIARFGLNEAISWPNYYRFSAPYKSDFLKTLASLVANEVKSLVMGKKKVLVLDCDNTLWGGIVGEDGASGLVFDDSTPKGKCFNEVQKIVGNLSNMGVITAICSKNNYNDVAEVFSLNNLPLSFNSFTCKKINWSDKADNIKEIASELNLGLDSFVFLDDSEFEIENMKYRVPEVTCFRVPDRVFDYPQLFREQIFPLFNTSNVTIEDEMRVYYYNAERERKKNKEGFSSRDDYINSLGLEIYIKEEDQAGLKRITQMVNKTNQFNLTSHRYNESEMLSFVESDLYFIFSGSVKDKFGDSGKTILAIFQYLDSQTVNIDSFLMSCRVIGRNLEFAFMDFLLNKFKSVGVKYIRASYVKTAKNSQVSDLYENIGFDCKSATGNVKEYFLDLEGFCIKNRNNVGIKYGK